jgi:hypothetical protein
MIPLQKIFSHYPRQRKLETEHRKKALEMMAIGGNKKKIQVEISKQAKKVVLLKDLHNLASKQKAPFRLADAVAFLKQQPGMP